MQYFFSDGDASYPLGLCGIFVGVNERFISIVKVQKRIKELLFKNIIGSVVILMLAYSLISEGGLLGVGYAWIIGQIVMNIVFILMWKFRKKSKSA